MRTLNPAGLGAEAFTLLLPSAVFAFFHTGRHSANLETIAAHASLVLPTVLTLVLFRTLIPNADKGGMASLALACIYALWLVAASIFYAVVTIGIESWGMIPTWRLVAAYLPNWQELLSTLGISPWAGVFLALLAMGGILLSCFKLITRTKSTWAWKPKVSMGLLMVCMCASGLLAGHQFYKAKEGLEPSSREPLMLAMNPGLVAPSNTQSTDQSPSTLTRELTGEREPYTPTTDFRARNVILIVGDALRADRMSLFGHTRKTTPFLDNLKGTGLLALTTRGHSVCAESFCGLLGLSRSKFVHEMPGNSPNLAEALRAHGYAIHFILGGDHTNFYGLADALGPYDSFWDGTQSGGYVNDDKTVLHQARKLPRFDGTPTFLQFHLMSTHALGKRAPEFKSFSPVVNYYVRARLPDDAVNASNWAKNYYDNGVLQLDNAIGELLETLRELGYLSNAVVVVTSDHGEMLGENGIFGHAFTVAQPALDIPILIARYGFSGDTIRPDGLASQVDIAPTILAELGITPPAAWSGRALQEAERPDFTYFQQAGRIGLFDHRDWPQIWKFWIDPRTHEQATILLDQDPHETTDLSAEAPVHMRHEWMKQLLERSPIEQR